VNAVISGLRLAATDVSTRTRWMFLRLEVDGGGFGLGELTGAEPATVVAELTALRPVLVGRPAGDHPETVIAGLRGRALAAAGHTARHTLAVLASALDLAWHDLAARQAAQPLWRRLGGRPLGTVELYANINRGLFRRTPAEFADKAKAAVRDGFGRIKCAPFDHLPLTGAELRAAGVDLLGAVRQAVGPEIELYVDAHAKLPYDETLRALPAFERLDVRWLEDAVPLHEPEQLADLRSRTGLRLAGGEQAYAAADLVPALETGALDVVLLDVKYVGGLDQLRSLIELVTKHDRRVSLHNPAGPVATVASAAATTLIGADTVLEYAYGETPWRAEVTDPAECVAAGRITLSERHGLGMDLSPAHAAFTELPQFLASISDAADAR
jgi:galactonate dehydratase